MSDDILIEDLDSPDAAIKDEKLESESTENLKNQANNA